ncbi:hypothetical protein ACIBG8_15295 [Nonomuraea sp. NPDC050556]|uniref:hypothetical protein n=1 Tax=Nonomuraea sp. NPDC050556 TaxID=3364369 RepID=UPI0037AFD3E9
MRGWRKLVLFLAALASVAATQTALAAHAAVPNRWGFAYVDIPSGIPNPSHQAGSWAPGPMVSVSPGVPPGQTVVKFPQIGGPGGVPHVTAVVDAPAWCQIERWAQSGPDELVWVRCYKYGGSPGFVPFTIVYAESTGVLPPAQGFGYLYYNGGGIPFTYNSAGGLNSVTPLAVGIWRVVLPGLGTPALAGNLQVTAVDPQQPARCKVRLWPAAPLVAGAQTLQVICHNATSTPINTGWTLTYHRQRAVTGGAIPPKNFAYTFDNTPANPGPYAPVPVGINFNSQGGVNTIQNAGPGLRLVQFPLVGVLPDDVQVTAYGPGPEYCNLLTLWLTSGGNAFVRDVACYSAVTRTNVASFTTYVSKF